MRKIILGFAVAIMLMAAPASAQRPVISGYQETVQAGEELHLTAGCVDCVVARWSGDGSFRPDDDHPRKVYWTAPQRNGPARVRVDVSYGGNGRRAEVTITVTGAYEEPPPPPPPPTCEAGEEIVNGVCVVIPPPPPPTCEAGEEIAASTAAIDL